jgi:ElaB/YqjD/DUF883 family membrane-anchored ribosome-binding protein
MSDSDHTEMREDEIQQLERQDTANDADKSPEELRAEIEATREHISDELEEIKARVNPDVLKEKIEHKVSELQEEAVDSLKTLAVRAKDTAQERPVMATLIGVGLLVAGATAWYLTMGRTEREQRRTVARRSYTETPYFPEQHGTSGGMGMRRVQTYASRGDSVQRNTQDYSQDHGQDSDMRYFHQHFETHYSSTGRSFEEYRDAYLFGRSLAEDEKFLDLPWDTVEQEAQRKWNEEHQSAWDDRVEAIQYGYERGRMHPTI